MRLRKLSVITIVLTALAAASNIHGAQPVERAEALWAAREDISKAKEALKEYEAALASNPKDHDILVRLSRLHYWIGINIEGGNEDEALRHFEKGQEWGTKAAEMHPEKPGGYFFKAANMGRWASLKGKLTSAMRASEVRSLNEKVESIQKDYFNAGPDRFFCAYYTKLPGILGGDLKKAVERGKKAVAAHPEYAGNHVYLAEAYFKDGNNDLARKELLEAISLKDEAVPEAIPEQRMEKKRAADLNGKIGK